MFKNFGRRMLALALVALMIVPLVGIQVFATTVEVLDGAVSITDTANSNTVSNGVVTIKATGTIISKKTNTVTITNETENRVELSFDYSASTYNSFTVAGASGAASGSYSGILAAGGSVTLVIVSNSGMSNRTATLTLSNFAITEAAAASDVTVEFDSTLGSVTVDGAAVSSGDVIEGVSGETGVALVATPVSGATFLGWINSATNAVVSTAASTTYVPAADAALKAVFVGEGSAPWFKVAGAASASFSYGLLGGQKATYYTVGSATYLFDDLNEAATAATSSISKYIVLMNNATLPAGDYTIPAGVTLLIPFDDNNTLYTEIPESTGSGLTYTTPTAYRTLTMADGANITVNGSLSLSGKHKAANGSNPTTGSVPSGATGFIKMETGSNITVENGGALYAWGYITGSGTVTANSGASVYELFQFTDFRGGSQSTDMENGVFPMSQYYVQNIEVPMTINYGAKESSHATIWMSSALMASAVDFFAPDSGAMFNLTSGYVVKDYDETTDRLVVDVNGDMTISPISMSLGTATLDSDEYELPINSNITVNVNSGTVTLGQDIAMLPGSQINVAEGAVCKLDSNINVYVYDLDEWGNYVFKSSSDTAFTPLGYAPGRKYTRTESDLTDAAIRVDGHLDATRGNAYTTAGGANIYSTGTGTVSLNAVAGTETVTYQFTQVNPATTYHEIPITPAKFKNADGTYLESDKTQGSLVYSAEDGAWRCADGTHNYTSEVTTPAGCGTEGVMTYTCGCGDSYTEVIPALEHTVVTDAAVEPTCTETGLTEGSHCETCGEVFVAQTELPALGHTPVVSTEYKAPTCVDAGHTEGVVCSVCSATIQESTEIPATGEHTPVVVTPEKAPTCSEAGYTEEVKCDVCGTTIQVSEEIPATGEHLNIVVDAAVDATCTETGLTEGSHCGDCGAVVLAQEVVPALGHTEVIDAAVEPTCTETGLTEGKHCEVCGEVIVAQEEVAALGHTEVIDAAVEPTCTETGLTEGKHCEVCGEVIVAQEEVAALGHDFADEFTVDVEPTATTEGSKSRHCANCDEVTDVTVIPALGEEEEEVLWGDVDGSGTIDGTDTMLLSRYTSGWGEDDYADAIDLMIAGDVDGSGVIDGTDTMLLSRYTSGWGESDYADAVNLLAALAKLG